MDGRLRHFFRAIGHESTINAHADVRDLVVNAAHSRKGIGTARLGAAEDHGRAACVSRLHIDVLERNGGACGMYRRHGFAGFLIGLRKPLARD